jgi:hypothetical protein
MALTAEDSARREPNVTATGGCQEGAAFRVDAAPSGSMITAHPSYARNRSLPTLSPHGAR